MSHENALRVAQQLLALGATLFVARPDPDEKSGYKLPKDWAGLAPDKNVLTRWRPGYALALVCGGPFDVIDIDPRNGGSKQALLDAPFKLPKVYAEARTPSGGLHLMVAALDVHKAGNILPGIDLQAGAQDGKGRGFVFIAPTTRVSKVDGETRPYEWVKLAPGSWTTVHEDGSGDGMRAWLTSSRPTTVPKGQRSLLLGAGSAAPSPRVQRFVAPKQDVLGNPEAALADGRHNGVVKIAGALIDTGVEYDEYREYMDGTIWPLTQEAGGHGAYDDDEFEFDVEDCWARWHKDPGAGDIPQGSALGADTLADMLAADGLTEWRVDPRTSASGTWYRWETPTWDEVPPATVHRAVVDFLATLHRRAVTEHSDEASRKVIRTWRDTPGRAAHLLKLAAGDRRIQLTQGFDVHPYLVSTASGVLDLESVNPTVREPRLEDYVRKSTPVEFVADAEHEDWAMALTSIAPEAQEWFQMYMGAALIGRPPEDASVLFQVGSGANGKTTITDAIHSAMGDYSIMASDKILLGSTDSIPTEVMDLQGARLAVVEELPQGRHINLARLKQLTGSQTIRARRLYSDTEAFPATHTLVINSNYTPRIPEVDHGTWRRLLVLPFTKRWDQSGHAPDPGIRHRLTEGKAQREAVLAWLVQGARSYLALRAEGRFPKVPECMTKAREAWRDEEDPVLTFLGEQCEKDEKASVLLRDLTRAFLQWRTRVSPANRDWSDQVFWSRLRGNPVWESWALSHKTQVRNPKGLSRPSGHHEPVPKQATVVYGLRFG